MDKEVRDPPFESSAHLLGFCPAVDKYECLFGRHDPCERFHPLSFILFDVEGEPLLAWGLNYMNELPLFPVTREPGEHIFRIPYRCREPDSLDMATGHPVKALKEHPEVSSPLRFDKGM